MGNWKFSTMPLTFDDLVSRSFFQQPSGFESCFVMHELLKDLAKYACGEIFFNLEVDKTRCLLKMTCHLSFAINNVWEFWQFTWCEKVPLPKFGRMSFVNDPWQCKISVQELAFLSLTYWAFIHFVIRICSSAAY